jgi:hypothetical protein
MKEQKENSTTSTALNIMNWILSIVFLITGILNLFLVHPVPGIFYIFLSFIYYPATNTILKKRFGFVIPVILKVILGFVVLWGTLAVGDLAEIFGL